MFFFIFVIFTFGRADNDINFEEVIFDFEGKDVKIIGKDIEKRTSKYYDNVSYFFKENSEIDTSAKSKKSLAVQVGWKKNHFGMKYFDVSIAKKPLKRDVKKIVLFVWSSKYKAKIYLKLNDYDGKQRFLYFSDLDYYGWKRLTINVPSFVNGKVGYRPLESVLSKNKIEVEGIRVEVEKTEDRDILIFLDRLSYYFNTIVEHNYDGADIEDAILKEQGSSGSEEGENSSDTTSKEQDSSGDEEDE